MKVLLTAFEPFGDYSHNSSQLCLENLQHPVADIEMVSHVWPVTYTGLQDRVEAALQSDAYDLAIHLGQINTSNQLKFERFAHNTYESAGTHRELDAGGEYVYHTSCPIESWVKRLQPEHIPAFVSRHAGLLQCNALYYWSLRFIAQENLPTQCCFIHIPLAPSQVEQGQKRLTLPTAAAAAGIGFILEEAARRI